MIQRTSKAGAAQLRRLAKAMHIARKGSMVRADGAWVVTSDTGHTYTVNGACQCADAQHPKRNGGWCKHRLAVWLVTELAKGERLPAMYAGAVQRIVKKHPVSGKNADGGLDKYTDNLEGSATETIFQARIDWLESEVLAMRKALGDLLDRYEGDLEARRAFAAR